MLSLIIMIFFLLNRDVFKICSLSELGFFIISIGFTANFKSFGKKGKTINAIRTLLMSVASRNSIRVNLEIIEENK